VSADNEKPDLEALKLAFNILKQNDFMLQLPEGGYITVLWRGHYPVAIYRWKELFTKEEM
jgi:hypothetical protein